MAYSVAHDAWKGVMHAVVTPFDADGAIDEAGFRTNIAGFLAEGVHGIVLAGDNGEAWALADDEKVQLTKITRQLIDETGASAKLVVGTTQIPTAKTVEATRRVRDAGADGVLVGPPTHLVVQTLTELMTRYETVARDGGLPIIVYNNPRRNQINLTADIMDRIADIPGIVGLKDSSKDFSQHTATLAKTKDRINVMLGPCTQIFPAVLLGGAGYISTGPDILGRAGVQYYDDLAAGRVEAAIPVHFKLQRIYSTLNAVGTWPASMKVAFDMLGKVGGYPRQPILPLGPADREKVRAALIDTGLLLPDGTPAETPALVGAR